MISRFAVSVSLRAMTSSSVLSSPPCPSFPFFRRILFRVRPRPSSSSGRSFSRSHPLFPVRFRPRPLIPLLFTSFPTRAGDAVNFSRVSGSERPRNVPLRRQLLPLLSTSVEADVVRSLRSPRLSRRSPARVIRGSEHKRADKSFEVLLLRGGRWSIRSRGCVRRRTRW